MTITNVLSATTQRASASFTITYEANNVNATVAVASRKQSQSEYTNATSNVSRTFYATNPSISNVTLSADSLPLGFDEDEEDTVFERYAVYRFTFTNNNSNGGKGLDVSATFTRGNMLNVTLLWIATSAVSTSSLATNPITTPAVSSTFEDKNNSSWPGGPYSGAVIPDGNGDFAVANGINYIGAGYSMCLFLFVAINDVSLPVTFTLGGQGNSSLSFTLTSHANT